MKQKDYPHPRGENPTESILCWPTATGHGDCGWYIPLEKVAFPFTSKYQLQTKGQKFVLLLTAGILPGLILYRSLWLHMCIGPFVLFPLNHPPLLAIQIFLSPFPIDSWALGRKALCKTSELELCSPKVSHSLHGVQLWISLCVSSHLL